MLKSVTGTPANTMDAAQLYSFLIEQATQAQQAATWGQKISISLLPGTAPVHTRAKIMAMLLRRFMG